MSRSMFGGSEDDYAVDAAGNPAQLRRVHFYTSAARTTEITDLASDAAGTGSPLTVRTDSQGFWGPVYGPAGTTVMYAAAEDAKGGLPTRVVAIYPHTAVDPAATYAPINPANWTQGNGTYVAKLLGQARRGAVQEIAVPSGAMTFQSVPKGVYAAADSIGVDGAVYSHASATQVLRSTDSLQSVFPPVLIDLSGVAGYTAGDTIVYCTRTSEGYVAVTANGDNGKIWYTSVAAGTSGWAVVQATRAIQKQAIAKPVPGPDGKTLLLFGEYGLVTNTVARNLWLSRDGGATWASILQTKLVNTGVNTHCHGSCYDPVRRRIWSSQGDGANAWFGYSDDFGKTWVDLPLTTMTGSIASTGYVSPNTYQQPVALSVLGERLIGTPDSQGPSGVWDMDPETGYPTQAFALASGETAFQQFGFTASDGQRGRELYLAFPDTGSGSLNTRIVGTGDWGRSWWLLATLAWTGAGGALGPLIGPDKNGWVYHKAGNFVTFGTDLIQARTPTWQWSTPGN